MDAIVSCREPPDIHLNPQKAIVNEEAHFSTKPADSAFPLP